jgi:hypothetical protein
MDSISIDVPIVATRDKGINKITITVDAPNDVDELYETNNSVTKEVVIYDNAASPVYPYDFSIVNRQGIKLVASTANPFAESMQYNFEMDTTELFNSPFKITRSVTSKGGILEFDPGVAFTDSTGLLLENCTFYFVRNYELEHFVVCLSVYRRPRI